ncbi:MAG: SusC/RagA family TonB-linked outer membrane protein [Bacteroidota bacterium]
MKRKLLVLFVGIFIVSVSFAQSIKGKIEDEKKQPVVGATAIIDGTKKGGYTDAEGLFEIKDVLPGTYKLKISSLGFNTIYKDVEVTATGAFVALSMKEDQKKLDEVVVVGYGVQRKREVTGSIAKISGRELNDMPVPSFESALQGKLAGVNVTTGSGLAGSGAVVRIRGIASIGAGGDPLYVVDGIPITQDYFLNGNSGGMNNNPLASINPNDIESIDVLKDAGASAIYGSRGANGVILITTKRGRKGSKKGPSVNFTATMGTSQPTALPNMLNTQQYLQLRQEAWENDGGTGRVWLPGYSSAQSTAAAREAAYLKASQYNTDWVKLTTRVGFKQNYDLSVSDVFKKVSYYAGVSYSNNESFLVGNSYNRLAGRLNLDFKVSKKIKVSTNSSLAQGNNFRVNSGWAGGLGAAMSEALPIYPVKFGGPNGDSAYFRGGVNPIIAQEQKTWRVGETRTINNIAVDYNPIKNLYFRAQGGYDYMQLLDDQYDSPQLLNIADSAGGNANRTATFTNNLNYFITGTYNYTPTDNHKFSFMLGNEFQKSTASTRTQRTEHTSGPFYEKEPDSLYANQTAPGNAWAFLSYFSRINYSYKDKYFAQVILRADWSSRFGENYRVAFMPAVSASWVLSEEKFLRTNKTISFLKLRASAGRSGNSNINGNARFLTFRTDGMYNQQAITYPTQAPNENLRWETSLIWDAGVELGLFNDRIFTTVDYFDRRVTDAIIENLAISPSTGMDQYTANVGKITNRGLEFGIKTRNLVGKFRWSTDFNITKIWNSIDDIGAYSQDAVSGGTNDTRPIIGSPIGTNYLVRFSHIDKATGLPVYLDVNGNQTSTWDINNRVGVGSVLPDASGGMTNTFSYKGFDLSVLINFVIGGNIYESSAKRQLGVVSNWNMRTDLFDRWQKPGDDAQFARLTLNEANYGSNTVWINTDQFLYSASFARLRNVTLAYNLQPKAIKKLKYCRSVRMAIIATNILTITKYPGLDPEIARDFENATDRNMSPNITYLTPPQERTYSFQINIGFN